MLVLSLNANSDNEEVTCEGKLFHIHAPATGKARRPTVESLTAGTDRLPVVEDRSLCRDGISCAGELPTSMELTGWDGAYNRSVECLILQEWPSFVTVVVEMWAAVCVIVLRLLPLAVARMKYVKTEFSNSEYEQNTPVDTPYLFFLQMKNICQIL